MLYRHAIVCVCGLLALLSGGEVNAQDAPDYSRSTLRVTGPLGGLETGDKTNEDRSLFSLVAFGVELSHMWPSRWTAEVSAITLTDGSNFGHTLAWRVGKTYPVHAKRAISGHLLPFAGYRYAPRPDYNHDGRSDLHRTHNVQVGLGYDIQTRITGRALFRLTTGADLVLISRFRSYDSDTFEPGLRSTRYTMFINASLGFAIKDLFRRHER